MLPCWAPWRVESTGDELFTLFIMTSSSSNAKASQNKPKRPRQNDNDTSGNGHSRPTMSTASPRFRVIHSQEERSKSSLSPFVIETVLIGMAGEPNSMTRAVIRQHSSPGKVFVQSKKVILTKCHEDWIKTMPSRQYTWFF